jgi:aspartyl protease family protein
MKALLAVLLALVTAGTAAQSVALQGMLGRKALLIVDGNAPRSVAPGETYKGVKVLSTTGDEAVVEVEGQRRTLRLGESPASVGESGGGESHGSRIVIPVGTGGHFVTQGAINGRAVQFMVDTGATGVGLSVADAERIGLNYRSGRPLQVHTANGVTRGWLVKLSAVRIGDVEVHDVDAAVSPGAMPYVLLGNTFLSRFEMTRRNDQMILERRY